MDGGESDGDRLPHGYTNLTRRLGGSRIEKRYDGEDRFERARTELACLTALAGRVPVPAVVEADRDTPLLVLTEEPGVHGQELIDAGHVAAVLSASGVALRSLHQIDPDDVPELVGSGTVIAHGDFGPQNLLVDLERGEVTAVLDWEFAHIAEPLKDLAWTEWIVRMHHPDSVGAIPALYDSYGAHFPWPERQAAMTRQCEYLVGYCEATRSAEAVAMWKERLAVTAAWTERGGERA